MAKIEIEEFEVYFPTVDDPLGQLTAREKYLKQRAYLRILVSAFLEIDPDIDLETVGKRIQPSDAKEDFARIGRELSGYMDSAKACRSG